MKWNENKFINKFLGESEDQKMEKAYKKYVTFFNLNEDELRSKNVLDVGADSGEFIKYLRHKLGNKDAVGIDPKLHPGTSPEGVFHGDAENIPYPDNSFDLIVSKNVFPLFISSEYPAKRYGKELDYKQFIAESLRVLKPQGRLMFDIFTQKEVIDAEGDTNEITQEKKTRKLQNLESAYEYIQALQDTMVIKKIIPGGYTGRDTIVEIIKL